MSEFGIIRKLGQAIDRHYQKKVGALPVPGSENGLLLVCYHPYSGKQPVLTNDQVTINPGETVGELHFNNTKITEIAATPSERSMEWRMLDLLKKEFAVLAEACAAGLVPPEVRGFYGVNVLAAGAKRMGFTLIPIPPGWQRWWLGFWESILRLIFYSFKTKKKVTLKRTMDPYEIWISRDELIRRYRTRQ